MIIPKTEFSNWLGSKGLGPKTIHEYGYWLDRLNVYNRFDQKTIDAYINAHKNNMARAMIKNLKQYLLRNPEDYGFSAEQIQRLQALDIPTIKKKPRKLPKVLTEQQVLKLVENMKSEATKLMVLLSFYCGLRVSDLLNMKVIDFNWETWQEDITKPGILNIPHGKGDKPAFVPVKPDVMQRLKEWINKNYNKDNYNPINPIFPVNYRRWQYILGKASNHVFGYKINSHLLRHSIAVHLHSELEWDINFVKEFLRHEDISTTQIYTKVSKKKLMEMYQSV